MYNHNRSVFNNSCLKLPKNPKSDHPLPVYEQKYVNQLENEARKLSLESDEYNMKSKKDKRAVNSFIDFYDSIPDYGDMNHLSNKEFYKQLDNLKEKQKTYNQYLQNEIKYELKDSEWIEDYKNLKIGDKKLNETKKPKPSIKPFCTTPILNKTSNYHKNYDDVELISLSDKETLNKPPSRRSVRIETPSEKYSPDINTPEPNYKPKSSRIHSASSKGVYNDWDELSMDDFNYDLERTTPLLMETKSAPSSPFKTKNCPESVEDDITIPKPFQMTVRDEENKIVEELYIKMKKPKGGKPDMFKAHDIPIESQIPLFDKIMADQEHKNFLVRERRKSALQAQMRPFSFTRRDEEIQALTKRLSKSSPSLYLEEAPLKIKQFKAKPIPRNLFSNYIYKKMHEDEFYRALQKKIRAEEMLRAASLPPSMAKREKIRHHFDVCPRSFRDLLYSEHQKDSAKKSIRKIPSFKNYHDRYERELEELKNEFISTSPRAFKLKTSKRGDKKGKKHYRYSSASSKSSDTRAPSSMELQSVNRSNLAAVLRIQSARKRLELEMCQKLEEAKLKDEARWREKIMRKKPVWQTLAYSHEEDLAMRLQLRRDEEKLRNEEHRMRMQLMLGRVNQQPTLFERQSEMKCAKTREDLMNQLYKEYSKKSPQRSISDLSDVRSSAYEMKEEAIQTFFEDSIKKENSVTESNGSKESLPEEKEKCESTVSDNEKTN